MTALKIEGKPATAARDGIEAYVAPLYATPGRRLIGIVVSRGLKALARELEVAVVALAQLSRAMVQRADSRPHLGDLRESGAIESDADAVLLLHIDPQKLGELQVIVAKNRHGPTGQVSLAWSPHYARARSLPGDAA